MKRCRECGQPIPDETQRYLERYDLHRNIFVWSFMTLFFWAIALSLPPQWSWAWWKDRAHVAVPLVLFPCLAIYFWVLFLRKRKTNR